MSNKTPEKPMSRRIQAPKGKAKKPVVVEKKVPVGPKTVIAPISGCNMITH